MAEMTIEKAIGIISFARNHRKESCNRRRIDRPLREAGARNAPNMGANKNRKRQSNMERKNRLGIFDHF